VVIAHPLRTDPGYRKPHGRAIEGRNSHAALQGDPNPPHNVVFTAMPDKNIAHGVIAGIVKCPFYIQEKIPPKTVFVGQAPSKHVQRADEGPFSLIFQPCKHVDLDVMAQLPTPRIFGVYPPASPWF